MFCLKCGNEIRNGEANCPECGTPVTPMVQQQSIPTPVQPQSMYPHVQPQQHIQNLENNCTSIGGWIGWWLLSFFLPVIGWIIAICVSKDQSVKNGIVAYIIVGAILLVLLIILAILGVFSAVDLLNR